ncbi:DUF1190 domain-containing protein [Vibrio owensii]|uniref:DUF1190 domain-containing protein n=1 Tax=Vibrio harveyi group TaxID=717610 RepID=UPI003CC5013C
MRDFFVNLFRYFGIPIVAGVTLLVTLLVLMVVSPKIETTFFGVANLQQCTAVKKQNEELSSLSCMKAKFDSEQVAKYHPWRFTQDKDCQLWFGESNCYQDNGGIWRVKPSGFAIGVNADTDELTVSPLYYSKRLNTHLFPNLTPGRYGKQIVETFSENQAEAISKVSTAKSLYDKGCIYTENSSSMTCSDRATFLLRHRSSTQWAD